jgi:Zn-dependent protease with chaperone function
VSWNRGIRQTHRWLSIAFTLVVIANFVALALGTSAEWLGYLALLPLFALLFTGLFLFFQPYVSRWRSLRRAG